MNKVVVLLMADPWMTSLAIGSPCRSDLIEANPQYEGDLMNLPGVDRAVIDEAKIRDYLLSDAHPVGRFKAAFFVGLGHSIAGWQGLAADLQRDAMNNSPWPRRPVSTARSTRSVVRSPAQAESQPFSWRSGSCFAVITSHGS